MREDKMCKWDIGPNMLAKKTSNFYQILGRRIAKSPGYFIIVPIFAAAILSTSIPSANFISNPDYLYTVINSVSRMNKDFIERTFVQNKSEDYDIRRSTNVPRGVWLIITSPEEETVLKKHIFKDISVIDKLVQKVWIKWAKKKWNYDSLCAKYRRECYKNTILDLLPRMKAIEDGRRMLRYPIESADIITGLYLGGVTVNASFITSAKAVLLYYFLNTTNPNETAKIVLWEEEVMNMLSTKTFTNITVRRVSTSSFEKELHGVIKEVLMLCIPLVAIMITLAVLTSFTANFRKSLPFCAALGCLSSSLAVVTAFGLIIYCSGEITDVCLSVPFLTLGVGMDDTFVMLAAWRRTDPNKSVKERLEETYSDSAVSITITSLTNFTTFCIGLFASYNAIRLFCLYAAISVLFTYIYQSTFFGACLALNAYYDCYCVMETYKRNRRQENGYVPKSIEKREHVVALWFRDKFALCLIDKRAKVFLLFSYFMYFGFVIWGCTKIQKYVDDTNCLPDDSYVTKFYNDYNKHFQKYRETVQLVINKPVNYADENVQKDIEKMLTDLEASEYFAEYMFTESWLRSYLKFLKITKHILMIRGYDVRNKEDFIKILREIFLPIPEWNHFSQDIVFSSNYTEITASRFLLQTELTGNSPMEGKMVEKIREVTAASNISSFAFGPKFVHHEQYLTIAETTLRTLLITAVVVIFIFFIFLPNIACVLSVGLLIISIEVGSIGLMSFWGVKLDGLCMLNLMLCIGYSIDYAAHMTHFYVYSKEETIKGRLKDSIYSAGLPILQCSISTLAGVILLVFAPAQMFSTFVKLVILVITLSTIHSLFILPLLFSFQGYRRKSIPVADI
ncbi:patched domain-containing protein 3-like [Centruroides vittatus]|uniref:patched domain-containing protein 3-like n=1 Tax=Centruroides vittatus TaxID=120091 RepID=UPI00350F6699